MYLLDIIVDVVFDGAPVCVVVGEVAGLAGFCQIQDVVEIGAYIFRDFTVGSQLVPSLFYVGLHTFFQECGFEIVCFEVSQFDDSGAEVVFGAGDDFGNFTESDVFSLFTVEPSVVAVQVFHIGI